MSEMKWYAGWYATKLHAVDAGHRNKPRVDALCGSVVIPGGPPTHWAKKRMAKGLPKCKHCLKRVEGHSDPVSDPQTSLDGLDAAWAWFREGLYELKIFWESRRMTWICWVGGDHYKSPTRDGAVLAAWRANENNEDEKGGDNDA